MYESVGARNANVNEQFLLLFTVTMAVPGLMLRNDPDESAPVQPVPLGAAVNSHWTSGMTVDGDENARVTGHDVPPALSQFAMTVQVVEVELGPPASYCGAVGALIVGAPVVDDNDVCARSCAAPRPIAVKRLGFR